MQGGGVYATTPAPDPASGVSRRPCKPYFHSFIPCTWSGHRFWLRMFPFTYLDSPILTVEFSVHLGYTEFYYQYFNLKWGSRRVWPVRRGCSLLCGTRSHLRIRRRSVLPYTRFCNCLLDYNCVIHIVNFAILYIIGMKLLVHWNIRHYWRQLKTTYINHRNFLKCKFQSHAAI
jgi:hypothetical protein